MPKLTMDVIGMCVVLRQGPKRDGAPLALGFLNDPGHLQTVHYHDSKGARLAALRFLEKKGEGIEFNGLSDEPIELIDAVVDGDGKIVERRLPFIHELIGREGPAPNWGDVTNALWAHIPLPVGKLTTLPAHIGDNVRWSWDAGASFALTDRLRFTAKFNGRLELGLMVLSEAGAADVSLTIASVDREYGTRNKNEVQYGFPLTEFALFYRCTNRGGPIPRCATVGVNPDSPICPMMGFEYN